MNFNIEGEFITNLAREWFYLEKQPYKKVEDLLLSCMCGTNISLEVLKSYCEDILKFKRKFIGNTKDDSFCLVEDDRLPDYIKIKNIDDLFLKTKENKVMFEQYGFIDRDGNFYPVRWCKHYEWADKYLRENYSLEERMKMSNRGKFISTDILVYVLGWILLHNAQQGRAEIEQGKNISKNQKETLYDYYMSFGREQDAINLYKEDNYNGY